MRILGSESNSWNTENCRSVVPAMLGFYGMNDVLKKVTESVSRSQESEGQVNHNLPLCHHTESPGYTFGMHTMVRNSSR